MSNLITKNINKLIYFLAILFFIHLTFQSLNKGGRWDLNQHIAMADKITNNLSCYSTDIDGFYKASSPYFPGVTFLSLIISKINIEFREEILLIIATLIGVSLLICFCFIAEKISQKFSNSFFTIFLISIWFFDWWKFYMTEFKPDSILLLFSIGILILIEKLHNNSNNWTNLFLFILNLYIIGMLKQQGVSIFFGIFLYLIFSNDISNKIKIKYTISIFIAGFLVLLTVYLTPNCINNTIYLLKNHKFLSLEEIKAMTLNEFKNSWLIYTLFFTSIINIFINLNTLKKTEKIWLFICTPWLIMSIFSFCKVGGNEGNLQSGILPFLPFISVTLAKMTKKNIFYNVFKYVLILFTISYLIPKIVDDYENYNILKKNELKTILFLNKKFKNKKALYNSDIYNEIIKSKIIPRTDMVTAGDAKSAGQNMYKYYNEIKFKKYDLVYSNISISDYYDSKLEKIILENYEYYDKKDIPQNLLYKILIPKQ